jgi:ABC-type dipeptide/oligopeptide/nickel transport system ATPase subunit
MSITKSIENRLDEITKNTKNKIINYIEPKKTPILQERTEQKIRLERLSNLIGLTPNQNRKLTLTFDNKKTTQEKNNHTIKDTKNYQNKNTDKEEKINDTYDEIEPEKFSLKNIKQNNNINILDITKYFKKKGVVGEEALAIKIFLAASNNMSFGVEGYSGSGKTFVVDKLIDLINEDELYKLDLSSKMALFYDSKKINNYKTIYIPELQKALQETKSPIVEVVKNLTEGKDVQRIVTDTKRRGNKTYKINRGKSIIYTLASENYYKKDEELNRRFLRFKTNNREEHLENILSYKSQKRQDLKIFKEENSTEKELKEHLYYLRNTHIKIFDPYSNIISEHLPRTQKSIGYVDHYFSLVDACAKFNYQNRTTFNYEKENIIITDLEDHYLTHKIYYEEFLETLRGFSERNNFDEEINEINKIKNKKINWEETLNEGMKLIQNKLKHVIKDYKTRNNEEIINKIKTRYDCLN